MSTRGAPTGQLGLIVPSSNTTAEPEFRAALSDSVTVHGARMSLESVTVDALDAMSNDVTRAAELLGHADVDAVAYACTTGSLLHGPGFDAALEAEIGTAADAPAVATARSVVRALEALDVDRIAVQTPYTADLDEKEREFLEESGIEVTSIDGRGIEANVEIGALTPEDATEQAREGVDAADVDAVFVSCTNYRSLAAVEELENDLGVPVVTSNGATLWDVARVAGLEVDGPGTLFEQARS
ncbi:maleate cis-trans isomerase family protein [Natronobacterium gregoryi]|uniref:Asp/Glu/hydantoin racemase n=2 Tax=Natronobacterium gregoryi TaxID=44930 RepID=L0AHS9_NATGS|nr:aspartate/glutamate racemase family protein [Natronobacterium gregoryi]AFZ73468.1 maleate cis-trans isomerase [Natronobacterium gregoryi SP2]ELY68322.1 Asp/Glu/hydantoin racemase [Natronobacterium gregoryi SP2]PLK20516.1 maleate cis-trans isomerase [Natronobacterium gregoryi SP2]SFI71253.1 maleate isomerase [Natronobacterium gregoryi]